jgi:hypothetical protein
MPSSHASLEVIEMWRCLLLVIVAAACSAPSKRAIAPVGSDGMTGDAARTLIQRRCGGCHKPSAGLPVFVGAGPLTPDLAVHAADLVCAREMPQDGALSLHERDQMATALCTLASSSMCRPCSAPTYVRSAQAAVRIVRRATEVDISESQFAQWLKIHSPRYALSTKLDATYLLLFTLMSSEACKAASNVQTCVTNLLRKENWQLPPPVR